MSEEWGPWEIPPKSGCPLKVGQFVEFEGHLGREQDYVTPFVIVCWLQSLHQGWLHQQIYRYRIRKPKGFKTLQRIAANPQRERIEA